MGWLYNLFQLVIKLPITDFFHGSSLSLCTPTERHRLLCVPRERPETAAFEYLQLGYNRPRATHTLVSMTIDNWDDRISHPSAA